MYTSDSVCHQVVAGDGQVADYISSNAPAHSGVRQAPELFLDSSHHNNIITD
jgi:hypothetical protein